MKLSVLGTGYIYYLMVKKAHEKLQTTQGIVTSIGCTLQTDRKFLLPKMTPLEVIDNREVELVTSSALTATIQSS